jgi:predicted MPP superfamily phosphohydrolase
MSPDEECFLRERDRMESDGIYRSANGGRKRRRFRCVSTALRFFRASSERLGLRRWVEEASSRVFLTRRTLSIDGLPEELSGFRILHVTDPHVDAVPGLDSAIRSAMLEAGPVDLCAFTGDYRFGSSGSHASCLPGLRSLALTATELAGNRVFSVLGNHDSAAMARDMAELGMGVLLNASARMESRGRSILVHGTDDVYRFWTEAADRSMESAGLEAADLRIALVHSQGLSDLAAASGFHLYLTGHTHRGQVALPFGLPLLTHRDASWRRTFGSWRVGGMVGHTSSGAGTSGMALRLFTRSEVALLELVPR